MKDKGKEAGLPCLSDTCEKEEEGGERTLTMQHGSKIRFRSWGIPELKLTVKRSLCPLGLGLP